MNDQRSDASTSTDDDLRARPLCLFYFTHPFGVLSPEPPTLVPAPAHVARAFLNMEPVSPLHFWSEPGVSTDSYDTATTSSSTRLNFDLGNAKVHKNPVNLVSVTKTRKCTIELGGGRESLSSSLLSSDVWFSSSSSSRRLLPSTRILPPLRLPAPQDSSTTDSFDDVWPLKCVHPAKFSLPPIEMPVPKVTKNRKVSRTSDEMSSVETMSVREVVKCRRRMGVSKVWRRRRAARLSGVRRVLACLMRRALTGGREGSPVSPALRRALHELRDAWHEPRSLFERCRAVTRMSYTRHTEAAPDTSSEGPRALPPAAAAPTTPTADANPGMPGEVRAGLAGLPPRPGASPGLLRRRYSMPETIMRKYCLAQQRSDSEESGPASSPSPASASPPRGSCGSLCDPSQRFARRDRELMRKSALLRRLWGRAGTPCTACCGCGGGGGGDGGGEACDAALGCGRETRSLDGSRSELRHFSGSFTSSRHSHAAMGWFTPKRQRLDSPLRGSEEMLRAAMRNSYDRAEESRYEKASKVDYSDSIYRSHGREASSYLETTTDAFTDSDTSRYTNRTENNIFSQYIDRYLSETATAEVKSDPSNEAIGSENSAHSFADTSDTFSTSMSTAKETNGSVGPKQVKQLSKSAHIDGRISERSVSVENDENNVLAYDTPLTVDTPSYELLEIVVSETLNTNNLPAIKTYQSEISNIHSLKAPIISNKAAQNINIDEYVSNILVESLNSLTDQLECINASMGCDRKINIVEKEIKVKLQNTGVNTIVHLSPTSNNQIIFGNEELYIKDNRKYSCNNTEDICDSVTIREELISVESNNNFTSGGSTCDQQEPRQLQGQHEQGEECEEEAFDNILQHENVNKAVLQQIQKLFQDELNNLDADINYSIQSIPGISHIEISNVDVFIDNNTDTGLGNNDTIELQTQNHTELSEIISGVGTGNYYEEIENSAVVPRFSAFPHTASMEVNTSSSDDAEIIGSDCTSLVDSLDDPNSPRSLLLRRTFNNNAKRSELVRSAIDILDLLPETASGNDEMHLKEKGEAFFIRIKDNDCDCEKENVIVADHMPEKIKQRLYRRHRKRELRMECARRSKVKQLKRELESQRRPHARPRRDLERECAAVVGALIDEVIAKIAQDEYKCMRIKEKPSRMTISKSEENMTKKTWKKDIDYYSSKESYKLSKNGSSKTHTARTDREQKKSERHHIHGKLSLLTHPTITTDDRGPKRIYQKSEIHDGNKCIEILEILEYVNGSQSSTETTNSDENHNNNKSKKSRIPIPVYEKIQKKLKATQKSHHRNEEKLTSPHSGVAERSRKPSNAFANMLMEVLADDDSGENCCQNTPEVTGRRASVPYCEPRSRSNSLRFRRVFDSIPEEKSSLSVDSSNEDVNHNRRASAPNLIDNLNSRHVMCYQNDNINNGLAGGAKGDMGRNKILKESPKTWRDTRTTGTSPLSDIESDKGTQNIKSQMTMTSPSHKSAATSPLHSSMGSGKASGAVSGAVADARSVRGAGGVGPAANGKRGLASRGRAWLGFTRPAAKLEEGPKRTSAGADCGENKFVTINDRVHDSPHTVRTIQTETVDPIIVGSGDRDKDKFHVRSDEPQKKEIKTKKPTERFKPPINVRPSLISTEDESYRHRETDVNRTADNRKMRVSSIEGNLEETSCSKPVRLPEFKASSAASSSDSSDSSGSLLCSLAPKWLSTHARHRRAARRRLAPPSPAAAAAALSEPAAAAAEDSIASTGSGGWSVTVAGSSRAALPADLEMRLRFPHDRARAPSARSPADTARNMQQECRCGECARRACRCQCGCVPPAARASLPPADAGKLTLTMKKEALDSSILASKSMKKSSDPLPDLETYRASRSKTKSSVKTRRGYSLHCWLPDDEPAPIRTNNGLSVLGCAIIPELKPRVPTMSERDLTRAYTPRHYLRS